MSVFSLWTSDGLASRISEIFLGCSLRLPICHTAVPCYSRRVQARESPPGRLSLSGLSFPSSQIMPQWCLQGATALDCRPPGGTHCAINQLLVYHTRCVFVNKKSVSCTLLLCLKEECCPLPRHSSWVPSGRAPSLPFSVSDLAYAEDVDAGLVKHLWIAIYVKRPRIGELAGYVTVYWAWAEIG